MDETLGILDIVGGLFIIVWAVLWIMLPFAVFGTKDKLNELIREARRTNEELKKIREEISGPGRDEI